MSPVNDLARDEESLSLRLPLLESLYRDQIPPSASNLRCRWAEMVTEISGNIGQCHLPKKASVQMLLKMYAGQSDTFVLVETEQEGSFSSYPKLLQQLGNSPLPLAILHLEAKPNLKLRTEPETFLAGFRTLPKDFLGFIDPLTDNAYPDELWQQLSQYFSELISKKKADLYTFPGGRYGAAKELQKRKLPFLAGYSLGQLAHIVQLALTPDTGSNVVGGRALLSYQADKKIAPRVLSQRHLLADWGLPATGGPERRVGQGCSNDDERWSELRHVLRTVLSEFPEGRSLALLKVDIERLFGLVLDQSVFRQVKLSHVFEAPELRAEFEVRRLAQAGNASQFIVRLRNSAKACGVVSAQPSIQQQSSKAADARIVPPRKQQGTNQMVPDASFPGNQPPHYIQMQQTDCVPNEPWMAGDQRCPELGAPAYQQSGSTITSWESEYSRGSSLSNGTLPCFANWPQQQSQVAPDYEPVQADVSSVWHAAPTQLSSEDALFRASFVQAQLDTTAPGCRALNLPSYTVGDSSNLDFDYQDLFQKADLFLVKNKLWGIWAPSAETRGIPLAAIY